MVEDILENINFQSKMQQNLINDLLDLSKIDSFNFKFNNDYFNMIDLIKNAFNTIKHSASKKNINLMHKLDAQISNENSELYG